MIMAAIPHTLIIVGFLLMDVCAAIFSDQVTTDGSVEITSGLADSTPKLASSLVRKAQIATNGSIEVSHGLVDTMLHPSPGLPRQATERQVTTNDSIVNSTSLIDSTALQSQKLVRRVTDVQLTADGIMETSRALLNSTPQLSESLVRKADGSIEISNGVVDPMPQLSPGLVRKQTEGQIAADGTVEISNGFVNSTQMPSSLVRKATEGQVAADGSVEISNGLVDSTRMPSTSLVRKAQITADGSVEIFHGLVDSMPQLSLSLPAKADGSIEISKGSADAMSQLSSSIMRKAQIAGDGNIETSNRIADPMPSPSPSLSHKATEGKSIANGIIAISKDLIDSMPQASPGVAQTEKELQRIEGRLVEGVFRQQVFGRSAYADKTQKQQLLQHRTIGGRVAKKYRIARQTTETGNSRLYEKQSNARKTSLSGRVVRQWEGQGLEMPTVGTVTPLPDATVSTAAPPWLVTTTASPSLATSAQALPTPLSSSENKSASGRSSSFSYLLTLMWICTGLWVCCLVAYVLKATVSGHLGAQLRAATPNGSVNGSVTQWRSLGHDAQPSKVEPPRQCDTISFGFGSEPSDDTDSLPDEGDFSNLTESVTPVMVVPPTPKSTSSEHYRSNLSKTLLDYRPMVGGEPLAGVEAEISSNPEDVGGEDAEEFAL